MNSALEPKLEFDAIKISAQKGKYTTVAYLKDGVELYYHEIQGFIDFAGGDTLTVEGFSAIKADAETIDD